MRVLVCGGRTYKNRETIYHELHTLAEQHGWLTIIEGGASGADWYGAQWARDCYHGLVTVKADWTKHGKSAGSIRNQLMIDAAKPDMVLAFPGNAGTADMVARAKAHDIPVKEVKE